MRNEDIIESLELLVKLWDVHQENEQRSKSLGFALRALDKFPKSFGAASDAELLALPGMGKSHLSLIRSAWEEEVCPDLLEMLQKTPVGLVSLLKVKGLGAKKVGEIWRTLGITDPQALEVACLDGRLAALKGFGPTLVESVHQYLLFLKENEGKLRLDKALALAESIRIALAPQYQAFALAGELSRGMEVIDRLVFLAQTESIFTAHGPLNEFPLIEEDPQASSPFVWRGRCTDKKIPLEVHFCGQEEWEHKKFSLSAAPEHLAQLNYHTKWQSLPIQSDADLYRAAAWPYIPLAMREGRQEKQWAEQHQLEELTQWEDLQGCVHNHSTYSDGRHSLSAMAEACKNMGLKYFGIADHSKTAAYAGGLSESRIEEQHAEIEALNQRYQDFTILKGIESDILSDGSLDYEPSVLASFDYVVASVHSGMNMDLEQAMKRLTKAIENPYTTILGHPSTRLLLSRHGFPLDVPYLLDACKANRVAMELNASPYRLDLDWRYIHLAMEKGVFISINPDAHSTEGLMDMRYGLMVAQKGGLLKELTFNALDWQAVRDFKQKAL